MGALAQSLTRWRAPDWPRRRVAPLAVAALLLAVCSAPIVGEGLPGESSSLPRHTLERQALVDPAAVLAVLPGQIERARLANAQNELALLYLAQANACRVVADWTCQRDAGERATRAATAANDGILIVRAMIAESRARMALQDFTRGEQLLGLAELQLTKTPHAELAADVQLAYSSLSFSLGRHALAADYAARGLAQLRPDEALPLQARLLRNQARALAQTARPAEARAALDRGLDVASRFVDPKLRAELHLESARLARLEKDLPAATRHAQEVLAFGAQLQNTQLDGLGHEILGLVARDAANPDEAIARLAQANSAFASLGLARDELRTARELTLLLLDHRPNDRTLRPLIRRVFAIDSDVVEAERAQAADDFDTRLKYAEQTLEVVRLESEAALAQERAQVLAARNRFGRLVLLSSIAGLLILGAFFIQSRRANRQLREAMEALRESDARAADLLQLTTGFLFVHNPAGRLLMANPATADALGINVDEVSKHLLADLVPPAGRALLDAYLSAVIADGTFEGTLSLRVADGSERWWRSSSRSSSHLAHPYVICQAIDVTEEVERSEALRTASLYDALTGAFNRRYLHEFETRLEDRPWGVLYFDLDGFKQINDTQGHERGDAILVDFVRFLSGRIRREDAVVRAGGDEFLVLLDGADDLTTQLGVERLRREAHLAPTAFSIGHACREQGETLAATIARADTAMYSSRGRAGERDSLRPDLPN